MTQSADATNRELAQATARAVQAIFPLATSDGRTEVRAANVTISLDRFDSDDRSAHQHAREIGSTQAVPIRADLELWRGGKKVQSLRQAKIGDLPLMNEMGSFMVGGNDYFVPFAQARLKSGVYTREMDNGHYEAFIRLEGPAMKVWLDPEKGIFKLGFGTSNVDLIPVLQMLGMSDSAISQGLGGDLRARQLMDLNRSNKPESDLSKLFHAIFTRKQNRDLVSSGILETPEDALSADQKASAINEWLKGRKIDPFVSRKTLGSPIDTMGADVLLRAARRILDIQRGDTEPDDRDAPEFKKMMGVSDLMEERVGKVSRMLKTKLLRRIGDPDVDLRRAVSTEWLNPATRGYFGGYAGVEGGLAHTAEAANPLAIRSESSKITVKGEGGIQSDHAISMSARLFRPSGINFYDPVHTPEGCYDPETEVYTETGWKFWPDVTKKDRLACLQDDDTVEYRQPEALIELQYDGELIGYKSDRVELLVTENHRMWTRPRDRGAKFRFELAKDIEKKNRNVACTHLPVEGGGDTTFTLPPVKARGSERPVSYRQPPVGSFLTKPAPPLDLVAWCRFLGWYLSEGHIERIVTGSREPHYTIGITQLHSSVEECAAIEETLNALPFAWRRAGDRRFLIYNKQLWTYLEKFGRSGDKFVPPEVFTAPVEARVAFLEAALQGDGRKRTKGKGERGSNPFSRWVGYCSKSERLATGIYRLFFELGLSAKVVFEKDDRDPDYMGCYVVMIHSFSERELSYRTHRHPDGLYYRVPYRGSVYCAQVPGGRVFVRRGESIGFWCGNSEVGISVHSAAATRRRGTTMEAPFYPVRNRRVDRSKPVYLTIEETTDLVIGYPEYWDKTGKPTSPSVRANKNGQIEMVNPSEVKYVVPSGATVFDETSNAAAYLAHSHPNRAMMAGKHITQALPLVHRERHLSNLVDLKGQSINRALAAGVVVRSKVDGTVTAVSKTQITVGSTKHSLFHHYPMQAKVSINHIPVVKVGDKVKKGQLLADSNYTKDGDLALGVNLHSAYMPFRNASNFEDAIVVSETAAKKLSSEHMHRMYLDIDGKEPPLVNKKLFTAQFPTVFPAGSYEKIGEDGVIKQGSKVSAGDVLVTAVRKKKFEEMDRSGTNLSRIHKVLSRPYSDASLVWDEIFEGTVQKVVRTPKKIEIHILTEEPLQVGDKLSMSSAAKGTISDVVPDDQMPRDAKGRAIEVVFNPFGVAGRMNPSQTIEQAAGKLVRDAGVTYTYSNFDGVDHARKVKELLEKNGLKHAEKLYDPALGKWYEEPVATGFNYVFKLDHPVRKKFSARERDGYTMDEAPVSGRGRSGQSYDQLTTYALLGHNAHAILGESFGIRGAKNDDFWAAYQAGETPPPPKVPFIFEKFRTYLNAAGIDTQQKGNTMRFIPMTDKRILEMSNGAIRNARQIRAKDLAEEKGGLFDVATTGGLFGDRYSHIELGRKIPHPLYTKVLKDLTGIKMSDFYGILGETRYYDPADGKFYDEPGKGRLTGQAAFEKMLDFNPKEKLRETKDKLRTAVGSDRNRYHRATKYLRGLQETGMKPADAYLTSVVPVVPPKFRSITEQRHGGLQVGDSNLLYRDLIMARDTVTNAEKAKDLPRSELAKARVTLYDSLAGLVGVGAPLTRRKDDNELQGFLQVIKGKVNKHGLFQRQLARRRNDYTGRSTIEPDANMGPDEVGIPEDMAWKIYKPMVVRRMAQAGWKPAEALKQVEDRTMVARQALDAEMKNRPVIYNRAPSLHRWNAAAGMPVLTPGKEIRISPAIVGSQNADADGDTMAVHVPVTEEARRESYNLLPTKNLFYDRDRSLAYGLEKDVVAGLFVLTKPGRMSGQTFGSVDEAIQAFRNNKHALRMDSLVRIKGHPAPEAIGWLIFQQIVPKRFLMGIPPPIDGKKLTKILERIAKESPGEYSILVRRIAQAGFQAANSHGGITTTVDELVVDRTRINRLLDMMETAIGKGKNIEEKREIAAKVYSTKVKPGLTDVVIKHVEGLNLGYGKMVESGATGKLKRSDPDPLRQMLATPTLVQDVKDRIVPSVIRTAYGPGMALSDYILTTPGARSGMVAKSLSTALPGFLAKEIAGNMGPIRVMEKDCGTSTGVEIKLSDQDVDILDRHLLRDVPGVGKRNDPVTTDLLARARDKKLKTLWCRSAMTCQAKAPPCQLCAGRDATGTLHPIGANIGLNYGQAVSERSTQLTLKCSAGLVTTPDGVYPFSVYFESMARWVDEDGVEVAKAEGSVQDRHGPVAALSAERHPPMGGVVLAITRSGYPLLLQGDHPVWAATEPLRPGFHNTSTRLVGDRRYHCTATTPRTVDRPDDPPVCEVRAQDLTSAHSIWVDYTIATTEPANPVDPDIDPYLAGFYAGDGVTRMGNGSPGKYRSLPVATCLARKGAPDTDNPVYQAINKKVQEVAAEYFGCAGTLVGRTLEFYRPAKSAGLRVLVPGLAQTKCLAWNLSALSTDWVRRFIAGCIDSDGSVDTRSSTEVIISTTSFEHAAALIFLARRCHYHAMARVVDACPSRKEEWSTSFGVSLRFREDSVLPPSERLAAVTVVPGKDIPEPIRGFDPISLVRPLTQWRGLLYDVQTPTQSYMLGCAQNHNSFHSGGTVGAGDSLTAGFKRLRELLSAPDIVRNQGTLSDVKGKVTEITPAPQGGSFITVRDSTGKDHKHYATAMRKVSVKVGASVDIGDPLSDGSYRPQEIAAKRGTLAAQQYVVEEARQAYQDAGATVRKPVLEVLAAGTMRYVEITDDGGDDGIAEGDIVHETEYEALRKGNPKIKGKATVPGISKKPLVSSTDLMERLNFQRLEDTFREIPAVAGTSDLTGAKSPIPGLAYGAMFRPAPNQTGYLADGPVFGQKVASADDFDEPLTIFDEW